jgi:hypothetical protein
VANTGYEQHGYAHSAYGTEIHLNMIPLSYLSDDKLIFQPVGQIHY